MRRTSKLAVGAAIVAAAVLALQGCAVVDGSGDDPDTLRVMIGANTTYPEQYAQWQRDVAAEFHRKTGADVQFETYASGQEELTAIQTSVISGQGPDVYSIGTTFTPTAYATGAFVRLTDADWDAVGGKDRFSAATLGISGPSSSRQIGIPQHSRPFVMAVNKRILAEHGITEMPTTWDQLTADARATTGDGTYGLAVAYADGFDPWKYVWGMSQNAGNHIVDGSTATIDRPAVQKAYQTYFDWMTKDEVVDPAAVGWNNSQALAAFADGKAAFFPMTTTTAIPNLDKSPVANDYEFAVLPTVPPGADTRPAGGVAAASILSGDNLVVANYSSAEKQQLAFEFVNEITTASAQKHYYELFGDLPTNKTAAGELAAENPKLAPIVQAGTLSEPTAFTGAWADIQLALVNVVTQSIPGLKAGDVSDAALGQRLAAAQKDATGSIQRQKNGGL
ncbi:ABC transporter substrate-binding protein [Curtobacterium sp. RRHDQ10]|uniref:ABC transporter substrate-binding protein n=1 Tax=Curtobacterium phyllosphaerae TaxID=3413379 RepID=UPI003BF068A1